MNCDGDVEGKYVQWLDRQTFKFVQATGQGDFKTIHFIEIQHDDLDFKNTDSPNSTVDGQLREDS